MQSSSIHANAVLSFTRASGHLGDVGALDSTSREPTRFKTSTNDALTSQDSAIEVRDVGKIFRSSAQRETLVFHKVNLSIAPSEFLFLLGPSGCGKSTLLNMIAGFEPVSLGRILHGNDPITKPDARRTMVFQDVQGSLFPWLTAQENVEFGLKMSGLNKRVRSEIARHYLELVGLQDAAQKMPFELSGGMKQRVQIARALTIDPQILLMDEPFGALDAQSRGILQAELEKIWLETHKTIVFVTHDVTEAVRLADRIVVFSSGPSAEVVETIAVTLDRPRLPTSVEVARLAQRVESLLHVQPSALSRRRDSQ